MKRIFSSTLSVLVALLLLLQPFSQLAYAQDQPSQEKDRRLGGRVWDGNKALKNVPVRTVNIDTGDARETETNRNGCFMFKDLPVGTYSLTVGYKGQERMLPEKIRFQDEEKLFACVEIAEEAALKLRDEVKEENQCKCVDFPILWILLGAGATPLILIPGDDDDPASPSTP